MSQHESSTSETNLALRRLLDENAILNLMARFDDAVVRQDIDTFRTLWVKGGIWEIGTFNPKQSKDVTPLHAQGEDQLVAALHQFNVMNEFFFRLGSAPLGLACTGFLLQYYGPQVTILLFMGGQAILALLATRNPHLRIS